MLVIIISIPMPERSFANCGSDREKNSIQTDNFKAYNKTLFVFSHCLVLPFVYEMNLPIIDSLNDLFAILSRWSRLFFID